MIQTIYLVVFAAIAILCGLYILLAKHPLHGALALIANMLSLAGIYSLLAAPFLGVVQVLTYAGAIMMLMVFVIMVLNSAHDHTVPRLDFRGIVLLAFPAMLVAILLAVLQLQVFTPHPTAMRGTALAISARLFDTTPQGPGYWILFEIIGLLLLAAMASAVLIAKKKLSNPGEDA